MLYCNIEHYHSHEFQHAAPSISGWTNPTGVITIVTHPIRNATVIWLDGTGSGEVQELRCTQAAGQPHTIAVLLIRDIWVVVIQAWTIWLLVALYISIVMVVVRPIPDQLKFSTVARTTCTNWMEFLGAMHDTVRISENIADKTELI